MGFIPNAFESDDGFSASLVPFIAPFTGVASGIPITVLAIDAPFDPDVYAHVAGASAVTILQDGRYRITYAGCGQNAPGPRSSVAWFLALDTGAGFVPVAGTLGETFHFGGTIGVGQAADFLETNLVAGDRVELQAILLSGGPNVTPTLLACKLGIVQVDV